MWIRCIKLRNLAILVLAVSLVCVFLLYQYRTQPLLQTFESGDDLVNYYVTGYSIQNISSDSVFIESHVPKEIINECLGSSYVRKGPAFRTQPSPSIEIRATYADRIYVIVIGRDGNISVAKVGEFEKRSFWVDQSSLYELLYKYYLEYGGIPLPY